MDDAALSLSLSLSLSSARSYRCVERNSLASTASRNSIVHRMQTRSPSLLHSAAFISGKQKNRLCTRCYTRLRQAKDRLSARRNPRHTISQADGLGALPLPRFRSRGITRAVSPQADVVGGEGIFAIADIGKPDHGVTRPSCRRSSRELELLAFVGRVASYFDAT